MRRASQAALLSLALGACGTNRPTIPDELMAQDGGGGASAGYPEGPYASAQDGLIGRVAENKTFHEGWMSPSAAGYDPATLGPISFGDFYDPTGDKYEILMVNTAAIWCVACQIEHGGSAKSPSLNEHAQTLAPKGLAILSLLYEDAANNPAEPNDLVNWTKNFETSFPMALDPEYQMASFQPNKKLAPFNMVLDARTMKILATYIGDQAAQIWPFIEQELDRRAAEDG
jgi:hypothetical protein